MKLHHLLYISIGALLLSGCANSVSTAKALQQVKQTNGDLRDYVLLRDKIEIAADSYKNNETLFSTYQYKKAVYSNGYYLGDGDDLVRAIDEFKGYCEGIGNKFALGRQAYYLLKNHETTLSIDYINYKSEAQKSNYEGFAKCEGKNGFNVTYSIGQFGVWGYQWNGYIKTWRRFYKVVFNQPKNNNKDYVALSNKGWADDGAVSYFKKIIKESKGILVSGGQGADWLYRGYKICKGYGGESYIINNNTDFKPMKFNDYLFKSTDYFIKKYPQGDYELLSLFLASSKSIYWCENPNRTFEFTFIAKDGEHYKYYPTYNKELIEKEKQDMKKERVEYKKKEKIYKSPELKLAKEIFQSKKDQVTGTTLAVYKGYYIKLPNNCELASIEITKPHYKKIKNFRKCGTDIEYLGISEVDQFDKQTENTIKTILPTLYSNCRFDGRAYSKIGNAEVVCKYKNDTAIFYILNNGKMVERVVKVK